jgi:hypothetical protein
MKLSYMITGDDIVILEVAFSTSALGQGIIECAFTCSNVYPPIFFDRLIEWRIEVYNINVCILGLP